MSDIFEAYVEAVENGAYHKKWVRDNPGEAAKWAAFRDKLLAEEQPVSPALATWYGRALVKAGEMEVEVLKGSGSGTRPGGTAPVNTVAPAITGTPTVGQTLTVSNGTWTNTPTSYTYQWQVSFAPGDYTNIPGATAATYVPVSGNEGGSVRAIVRAQNAGGETSAFSNAVTVSGATSSFGTALPARLPTSTGTEYFVSASGGSNSNDGLSSGNAWATIQHAFNTVPLTGSIINLLAGTHSDDTSDILWTRAGNSSNPVTLRANPGDSVTVSGDRFLVSGSYLRIEGFTRDGGLDGVKPDGGSHHIEIVDMTFTGQTSQGILIGGGSARATDIQVWNSVFHTIGDTSPSGQDHCIYIQNADNIVIANCLFYNMDNGYGIQIYPGGVGLTDVIVTCCTLDDLSLKSGIVIGTEGAAANNTGNRIHGCIITNTPSQEAIRPYNGGGVGNVAFDCIADDNGSSPFPTSSGLTFTHCSGSTDPLYTNVGTRDYTLQAGSPAIGFCVARPEYVPATDINGDARVTADAGCYAA